MVSKACRPWPQKARAEGRRRILGGSGPAWTGVLLHLACRELPKFDLVQRTTCLRLTMYTLQSEVGCLGLRSLGPASRPCLSIGPLGAATSANLDPKKGRFKQQAPGKLPHYAQIWAYAYMEVLMETPFQELYPFRDVFLNNFPLRKVGSGSHLRCAGLTAVACPVCSAQGLGDSQPQPGAACTAGCQARFETGANSHPLQPSAGHGCSHIPSHDGIRCKELNLCSDAP